ncbi:MAG: DMT family transporter, partial [Spirochaetaceae bacterium]|nr:DMT family transporter [Spirochaetaceae bacterium]
PVLGALITLMNRINSDLAAIVGTYASSLVIHVAGLAAVSLALLVRPEPRPTRRLPPYRYSGGLVGVATVFLCNAVYGALDASLAVALALLGQMLGSILIDATGFLGRTKYPFRARNLPGLALACAGAALLAGGGRAAPGYIILAVTAGALPLLSITLNAKLALDIGLFRGVRANYLVGFAATLLLAPLFGRAGLSGLSAAVGASPLLLLGGGLLGVSLVAGTNLVFPRLPTLHASILMFAGQILSGLAIDLAAGSPISARTPLGLLAVLAGLSLDAGLKEKAKPEPAAAHRKGTGRA